MRKHNRSRVGATRNTLALLSVSLLWSLDFVGQSTTNMSCLRPCFKRDRNRAIYFVSRYARVSCTQHGPHRRVGSRLGQRAFAFGHEPVIERFVRSIQGDGGQAVTHLVTNEFSPGEVLAIR